MFGWLRRKLLDRFLKSAVKKVEREVRMKGWKTKLAGLSAIIGGVGLVVKSVSEGDFAGVKEGVMAVIAGLAVLGIGHKIEKAADA